MTVVRFPARHRLQDEIASLRAILHPLITHSADHLEQTRAFAATRIEVINANWGLCNALLDLQCFVTDGRMFFEGGASEAEIARDRIETKWSSGFRPAPTDTTLPHVLRELCLQTNALIARAVVLHRDLLAIAIRRAS